MSHRTLGIMAFLVFAPVCLSQVRPRPTAKQAAPPAYMKQLKAFHQEGAVTRVVLNNDLTVLVVESHVAPVVEVLTWIKVGYRDDPANLPGISRVLERMLVRGTTSKSATVYAADLMATGGEFASRTAYDHTLFRLVTPAIQWKRSLEIQSDMLLNPLLDTKELQRQIQLMREIGRFESSDPVNAADTGSLLAGLEGVRPDRPPPLDSLSHITREDLLGFYRWGYHPSRALLIVCGDVTASEVINTAVGLYGKSRELGPRPGAPEEKPQGAYRYIPIRAGGQSAGLLLGFPTAAANASDYPALQMLRAMLATGEGAVLNLRLKHQKGIVFRADADHVAYDDAGFLILRFELDPEDLDRCEIAVFAELEILKRQGADPAELARARSQLEREYWESLQTVSGRAERVARFEALGSWKGAFTYPARLDEVKGTDIARVAAKYLRLDACAVIESLPTTASERQVTAETLRGTIQELLAPAAAQEIAKREKVTVPAVDLPAEREAFTPSEVRHSFKMASILRGPELYIKEEHTTPWIHLGLFYPGGRLEEAGANAGITSLMLRTMLRGSAKVSGDQLYRQLEIYGGRITSLVEEDCFGFHLSIAATEVEKGLDLLREMIQSPVFDPEIIERQKRLQMADIQRGGALDRAQQQLRENLYRGFSYALARNGTASSLQNITPAAIEAWYRNTVADKRPMIVIIGDTRGTSLAGYFVRNFSGSRFEETEIARTYAGPLEKKIELQADWDDSASVVLMAFQAPPEGDEDANAFRVLQQYIGGFAGRFREKIPEEVQSAWGISVAYEPKLRGGSVTLTVRAAPADEEVAAKVLAEEVANLTTASIMYRDYRSAVNAVIGRQTIARQDRFRCIADGIRSILAGRGLEGFQDNSDSIRAVQQADIQEIAQRVFRSDKAVMLRLHGRSER